MNQRANLTESESNFLGHMIRWGSDGYPVQKVGRNWIWGEFCGIKGAPTVYRTKRECVAAISTYEDLLIDKSAGRVS